MFRFRELVLCDADRLAHLITAEHGKTFGDSQGELARGLEIVEFVCGIAHLLKGEMTEQVSTAVDSFGGWKRSIFRDHAMHGMEGVRFYTRLKTTTTRWPKAATGAEYAFPTVT